MENESEEEGAPMSEPIYTCDCGKRWKVDAPPEGQLRSIRHVGGESKIDWEAPIGDDRLPTAIPVEPERSALRHRDCA